MVCCSVFCDYITNQFVWCNKKMPYMPVCGTVSEIDRAQGIGLETIKIFPGQVCGSEFIKAVLGHMPWSKLMPTGGVMPSRQTWKNGSMLVLFALEWAVN